MTTPSDPGQPEQNFPGEHVPPPGGYPSLGEPPPQSGPAYPSPPSAAGYPPPPNAGFPPPGSYPAAPTYQQLPQTDAAGRVYDPVSGLHLPPGTELASNGRRIGAYFLAIPLFIVTLGIGYIIWGLILWGQGTSPALRVLKMKCYRVDTGTVPGWGRMFLRDVLGRIVDGILSLITELVSFIMFLTTQRRQSLHDVIASTTVLYDPNKVLG